MSEWLVAIIYIFGISHAIPVWYFGKAAGLRQAQTIVTETPATKTVTVRVAHIEGTMPFVYIDPKDK